MRILLAVMWLSAAPAQASIVERVVAQVNGEIISESNVGEREQSLLADLYRQGLPPDELDRLLAEARTNLLADMIDEKLLIHKADELGVTVAPEQLDAVVQSIMDANDIADTQELAGRLKAEGMTLEALRANVATRTLIEKVKQFEIASRIVVTDEEAARYYEQNRDEFREPARLRMREIVLLTENRPKEEVLKELEEIRNLIKNGSDFAELATFFSQAPSADHGGDMGLVETDSLSSEIQQAAAALEPGEVSAPIATRYGFHLLKLEERRERALRPLQEVQGGILAKLQQKRYETALTEYIKTLRQRAFIKVFPTPPGAKVHELPPDFISD